MIKDNINIVLIEEKKNWDKFVADYSSVFIYGAGKNTEKILTQIDPKLIKGIFVSAIENNPSELSGIPVIDINKYTGDKSIGILLGTVKDREMIIDNLMVHGYFNIAVIDSPWSLQCNGVERFHHRRIKIDITTKIGCIVNCTYCPQKVLVQRYKEISRTGEIMMSLESFKKYLSRIPKENSLISFAGFSEPFGNPEAVDMILYASEQGYEVDLFSTLQGLSIDDFYKIAEIPFSFVNIHVPDKEGHAYIPKTESYIKLLKTVLDYKHKDGRPFASYGSSQGTPDEEIMKIIDGRLQVFSELHDRGGNLDGENLHIKHDNYGSVYCSGSYDLTGPILLPDGSLTLCCNDFGLKHIIGNLNDKSYDEIMNDAPILNIKNIMKDIKENDDILCKNCTSAVSVSKYCNYSLWCEKYGK